MPVLYVTDEGGKFGVYRMARKAGASATSFKRIKTIAY